MSFVLFVFVAFLGVKIPESMSSEDIRVIVRGDDMGMTQGSLVAFERAFIEGILTCGSMQVCAPWFEAAADLVKRNSKWCIGVHLTLIGEWRGYRWRPVLPWSQVGSLVDENGFFFGFPAKLWANNPKMKEIEAEFRAQINLAIRKGVKINYLDTHYIGYKNYPGLEILIEKIGKEFGLPISGRLGERYLKGIYKVPLGKKMEVALKMLEELGPGLWLWVTHPGIDSPEQRALVHTKMEDFAVSGGVGLHRTEETGVLTSPEIKETISKKKIKLRNYRELNKR